MTINGIRNLKLDVEFDITDAEVIDAFIYILKRNLPMTAQKLQDLSIENGRIYYFVYNSDRVIRYLDVEHPATNEKITDEHKMYIQLIQGIRKIKDKLIIPNEND